MFVLVLSSTVYLLAVQQLCICTVVVYSSSGSLAHMAAEERCCMHVLHKVRERR
jgi:hypothetical protein